MTTINFYSLQKNTYIKGLIKLLQENLDIHKKGQIVVSNPLIAKQLDDLLWTECTWLPHSLMKDHKQMQTNIVISESNEEILTDYPHLFLINDATLENIPPHKELCVIFNADDKDILAYNRQRWKDYKQFGYNLQSYNQINTQLA